MRNLIPALALMVALLSFADAQARRRGSDRRNDNAPKVGQDAPNFKAKKVGKDDIMELKVSVKEAGKPTVLIFGSYT